MRTLDRYIIKTFLSALGMWFVVFMSLRIVMDLFINMDEFTEADVSLAALMGNIGSYYLFQSLTYITEMGGIIIVAAAAFAVARMNHTNELTAMLASGVSLHRVVWPIILTAMVVGGLVIVDQEFVIPIPEVREKLARQPDEVGTTKAKRFQVRFMQDSNKTVWYSGDYDAGKERMYFSLVILRDKKYRYLGHFSAETAEPGSIEDHKGWMAHSAVFGKATEADWTRYPSTDKVSTYLSPDRISRLIVEKEIEQGNPDAQPGSIIEESPVEDLYDPLYNMFLHADMFRAGAIIKDKHTVASGTLQRPRFRYMDEEEDRLLVTLLAEEAYWPPEERNWRLEDGSLFYETDLRKEDLELRQSSRWLDYLSSSELSRLLQLRNVLDPEAVLLAKYNRFADPVNNLVMLLLGLPFILSRERNLKASAGLALLMVGAFYVFIYICRYMGLPEFLGAFLPVMIFGPVAVLMLDSIKT